MVRAAGESDLAEVAALFAGHTSPELAADLALEIVLNEIVEQACLATGADGAAIVLPQGGEWVCRATAGQHAPRLGARLDDEAGLSGACIRTRKMQRCDEAQDDSRADLEACRKLGVRSVIILPLLRNEELAGLFEVFSSRPSTFGSRDERTLEALSQRVLKNIERASETLTAPREPAKGAPPPELENLNEENIVTQEMSRRGGIHLITWALGATVLAFAVLMAVRAVQRLSGARATAAKHPQSAVSAPVTGAADQMALANRGTADGAGSVGSTQSAASGSSGPPPSVSASEAAHSGAARAAGALPPEGSLLVYENGKEVFRISPPVQASGIQVSPEVAEGSVVYRVEPEYPEEALLQQIQGTVMLDVRTTRDGAIQDVKVVSGEPLLANAAIAAVKQWRFRPRMVNGQRVEMQTKITLNFSLPSASKDSQ